MALQEYRRKRRFAETPEPPPARKASTDGNTFVVQKHAARRLHYDFRLEVGGVLKSWAVPKGPSLNPSDKRLAVQTEDHPLDYGGFEGTIPDRNYGAGNVMVWDRGYFNVEGDLSAEKQLARGELKFSLQGEKLRGSFVLVRLKRSQKGNEWLLIKHRDEFANAHWDVNKHDGSTLTGRDLDEIGAKAPPKQEPEPISPKELDGAKKGPMPARVLPTLATLEGKSFSDPDWLFEIKWDGVRALAWIEDGDYRISARSENDITRQYPELRHLPAAIHASRAILDGEIVALDDRGRSNFEKLQQRMHVRSPAPNLVSQIPVVYYLFDLLYCDGYDLRDVPLVARKELLRRLLLPNANVRFSDHQMEHGRELFELAKEQGLEGIVAKRADSRYAGTRTPNWIKIKVTDTVDAVVGGWTAPRGSRSHFGSLLLGLYDGKKLRFIGHVGSGFDDKKLNDLFKKLSELQIDHHPFDRKPDTNEQAYWTRPELVATIRYTGWTDEGRLRAPVFLRLRQDKTPEECHLKNEKSESAPAAEKSVVRARKATDSVLADQAGIEAELSHGKMENVLIELGGKRLRLSHLNKLYFPEPHYTKRDLLFYYFQMADYVLPFLKDRPLVLRRYPDGVKGQAFFQKDMSEGLPDWFKTVPIKSESKRETVHYGIANDVASLLFLTNLGCIDHNPWSSRSDDVEHPDYFFFDLDPSEGTDFKTVIEVGRSLAQKLEKIEASFFLKTSGATGLHIYLPFERGYNFAQLRAFGDVLAHMVASELPKRVTFERIVAKRPRGSVLIDVTHNSEGRPLAAAYCARAFPKATVSAPITTRELRGNLNTDKFTIKSIPARVKQKGDLWADFWKHRQRIEPAVEKLNVLIRKDKS